MGQPPFVATSSWNVPIPTDATYVDVGFPPSNGWNYGVSWSSYAPAIWFSAPGDPTVDVLRPDTWGWPAGTVSLRIPRGITGADGTDGEILVIDGTRVHNMWQFVRISETAATAAAYAMDDVVTGTGWGTRSPWRGSGITAAGHSMLAGLLIQAETDGGDIRHALQLAVDSRLNRKEPHGDAIASDGNAPTGIVHQGQRLAISRSTPMPSNLSPLGQKVFRALQAYGAFDIDNAGGTTSLRAQANAYDAATMQALHVDMQALGPLLRLVSWSPQ